MSAAQVPVPVPGARRLPRRLIALGVITAVLVGIESALLHACASTDAASAMLAGGGHVPVGPLLLLGVTWLLRVSTRLVLPGLFAQALAGAWLDR